MHVAHPKHRVALRVDKVVRACLCAVLRTGIQLAIVERLARLFPA